MEKKEASHVEESVKERDEIWQTKMSDKEKAHQEVLSVKVTVHYLEEFVLPLHMDCHRTQYPATF